MSVPVAALRTNGSHRNMSSHTLTGLKRWSCADNDELPSIPTIKHLHVYDFDNTLFATPLPSKVIWNGQTIGLLQSQDAFSNGGWWHNPNILASTGEGLDKEEPKAWEGWWNEQIVNLVELTMQQKDALNVLLTGRSERGFAELVNRIAKSKNLAFHMTVLKPEVGPMNQKLASTMKFKQAFLDDLIHTYHDADEIRMYEDRPKHVIAFREFFTAFNKTLLTDPPANPRKTINAEVIEVAENSTSLDPVQEVAEVQRIINSHNTALSAGESLHHAKPWIINRTTFYTAYLISPPDTEKLLAVGNLSPKSLTNDIRTMANSIMITPRPASQLARNILDKVGGLGKKMRWRVVGTGNFDNRVWAARVEPVTPSEKYYCENPQSPNVVLALRKNTRPSEASRIHNWTPLPRDMVFEFETVVGEKIMLRIDEERPNMLGAASSGDGARAQPSENRGFKRLRLHDDEFPALGAPNGFSTGAAVQGRPRLNVQVSAHAQNYHTSNLQDENRRPNGPGAQTHQVHEATQSDQRGGGVGAHRGLGGHRFEVRGGARGSGRGGQRGNQRGGGGVGANVGAAGRGRGRGGFGAGGYRSLDDVPRYAQSEKGGAHGGGGAGVGMDGARDERDMIY